MEETRKWVEEGGKVRGKGVMELKKKSPSKEGKKIRGERKTRTKKKKRNTEGYREMKTQVMDQRFEGKKGEGEERHGQAIK